VMGEPGLSAIMQGVRALLLLGWQGQALRI
jgi:hypothetical protein